MTSGQIKIKIRYLEDEIKRNKSSIKEYSDAHKSLTYFKQKVYDYQTVFSSGNKGQDRALEQVLQISQNCDPAKKYYVGMKRLISRMGGKIVDVLLEKLMNSAQNSMSGYVNKISQLEGENERYTQKIEELKRDLKIKEMEESFVEANK